MTRKTLRNRISQILQYFPFTINTFLFSIVALLGYKLLYTSPKVEDMTSAAYRPFVLMMGKLLFWFLLLIISVSLLSTLVAWLYYLWLLKKKDYKLDVVFSVGKNKKGNSRLYTTATIRGAIRPLLGFIKVRLFFDDFRKTDKFGLLSGRRKSHSVLREAIFGKSRLLLPDIKEYSVRSAFLFYEDLLRIVSLPVAQPLSKHFYRPPHLLGEQDHAVAPKKTESQDVRIEELRRVEGEHLNYKDFEPGDDVRRIVWKVYARNRELVVRVPERLEPFASHLYFYASFHSLANRNWSEYYREMLNYYKNRVWSLYQLLHQKEWSIRYIPDQQFTLGEQFTQEEKDERIISNSNWQNDRGLLTYFNPGAGSVLVISSLNDIDEITQILDSVDDKTVIYFVKLSDLFRQYVALNWLRRLIFIPSGDRLAKLKSKWIFSGTRQQLLRREKEIEQLLSKR